MGASCSVALDLFEQRGLNAQQERLICKDDLINVAVSGLNRNERGIGNLLKSVNLVHDSSS
jgi:hypothetical protein